MPENNLQRSYISFATKIACWWWSPPAKPQDCPQTGTNGGNNQTNPIADLRQMDSVDDHPEQTL